MALLLEWSVVAVRSLQLHCVEQLEHQLEKALGYLV